MGAPKQKWTAEEEAALRAGVAKYGPGKWRPIQRDAQLGPCLTSRSNIDLKDKWRNMSAGANGLGSTRERKSLALPSGSDLMTLKEEAAAITPLVSLSPDGDSKPLLLSGSDQKLSDQLKSFSPRSDDVVVDAVLGLKDSYCSSNATTARNIEERHQLPSNFRRLWDLRVGSGKLVKVNDLSSEGKLEERPAAQLVKMNDSSSEGRLEERPAIQLVKENDSSSEGRLEERPAIQLVKENDSSSEGRLEERPAIQLVKENDSSSEGRLEERPAIQLVKENDSSSEGRLEERPAVQLVKVNDSSSEGRLEERPVVQSTRQIRNPEGIPYEITRTPRFPGDPAKKMRGDMNTKKPTTVEHVKVALSRVKAAEEARRIATCAAVRAVAAASPGDPAKKMRGDMNSKKQETVLDVEVTLSRMRAAEEATRVAIRAAVQAVAEAEAAAAAAEQAAHAAKIAEAEAEAAEATAAAAKQAAGEEEIAEALAEFAEVAAEVAAEIAEAAEAAEAAAEAAKDHTRIQ